MPNGNLLLATDSRMADGSLAGWLCNIDLQGNVIWEKTNPLFNTIDEMAITPAGNEAVLHNIGDMSVSIVNSEGAVL